MEYLIIVLFGALIINESSKESSTAPEPVAIGTPKPIVEEGPVYKPNHYFLDQDTGYYTSDLSARPTTASDSSSTTIQEQEK
jgi:hypothetical protein